MTVPDMGQMALLLAIGLALYAGVAVTLGARRGQPDLAESGRNAVLATALMVTVAAGALLNALLTYDFSLQYVVQVSSRDMPWDVVLTSFWGGQAGSLLFWAWMLALFAAGVVWANRDRFAELMPATTVVLMGILTFFLLLLAFVSTPFERLPAPVADGRGLNPLLWDDGMRIHPPLLLTGYMSFTIPFAFAVAALITGHLDNRWLRAVRPWLILSWAIQGAGLLAGAWWAYHVLGWGGYWGWDPVENAALLPWLTATAALHSVMVQERRGMLKVWNLTLIIATFALAIFGTFVVRSGVLSSVHSFAQSAIGPYFFGFLGVTLIGTLGLFVARLPQLRGEGQFESLASREVSFLFNNFLLVGVTLATFWGTVFPLISELVRGTKVTVGPPFYQQVNGPLLLALIALMGIGPLLAWRRTSQRSMWRNFRLPLALAGVALVTLLAGGMAPQALAALAFAVCAFVFGTIGLEYYRGVRARHRSGQSVPTALMHLVARNRRRYGGYIVHVAVLFMAVGVIGSSFFQQERVVTLGVGETAQVGRYAFTYQGLGEASRPGLSIVSAPVVLSSGDRSLGTLDPQRRTHRNWEQQPISGIAITTTLPWLDDVYVLVTGWDEAGRATFRIFVNPMVALLWIGAAVFLAGTVVVLWPEASPRRAPVVRPARPAVASEVEVT
ncbi:MAG: heme lyase CcmF/NrfE family subunit [Chloroflexi bacterium]|nr:heme lyase CcmF/NrfE family subunit [Chloroflexota bacterium]